MRNQAYDKVQVHQEKVKKTFDKRVKEEKFQLDGLVLNGDARKEEKHDKFYHLCKGP